MAEQVPAVCDVIERRNWTRLRKLLHPDIHWTTAVEEHLHGADEVIALAEPPLESLNLRSFFVAVIGPELDSENEQKAVTVGRAMREFAPDANLVMVGDRKHDIRSIGGLWGIGSEEELRTAGADALAHTPTELATLLTRRYKRRPWQAKRRRSQALTTRLKCSTLGKGS